MSGSTIGGIAGGVIGFFAGNPQLGFMIGSAVGGYLDPAQIEGPRLKDAQVQTSDEGVPRPIIYGRYAVAGNLIQRGDLIERKKTERAGKGGPEQTTYSYYMSYAIRVCEGPVSGISRIWRDDKLVYDARVGSNFDAESASFSTKLTIYLGDESQMPDATLEALPAARGGGIGNVPAYRGTCYVVFENDDLTERNGTIPQYRFEVSSCGQVTQEIDEWWLTRSVGSGSPDNGLWVSTNPASWPTATSRSPSLDAPSLGPFYAGEGVMLVAAFNSASDDVERHTAFDYDAPLVPTIESVRTNISRIRWFDDAVIVTRNASTSHFAYSTDKGLTWTTTAIPATGGPTSAKSDIARLGNGLWLTTGHGSAPQHFWRADTENPPAVGEWTSSGLISGATGMPICCNGTAAVIFKSGGSDFYRTDDGVTWDLITLASHSANNGDCIAIGDVMLHAQGASGNTRILRSTDAGVTWASVVLNASVTAVVDGFAYGDGIVVACVDNRVYWSDDDGATWTASVLPFTAGASDAVRVGFKASYIAKTYALPDAPGYTTDAQGNVSGPPVAKISDCTATLSDIVEDLCTRVGLTAVQLDVSALTDEVTGFAVARQMPAGEAIKPLQQVFFFDLPEWDLKLRAVNRGGAAELSLTEDDFVQSDDDEETRGQAVEFPRKLNLYVTDPSANYARIPVPAERSSSNVRATGEMAIEAPLAFDRQAATEKADILLKVAWEELQGRLKRKLPAYKFAELVPSDIVLFDDKRWRITRIEVAEGVIDMEAIRDRASNYGSTATANSTVDPTTPVSSTKGPTMFAVMNLPSLRSADNVPGVYLAARGLLPGWEGADVYLSTDDGVSEQKVATLMGEAVIGELAEDTDADGADSSGLIVVQVFGDGELDSVTEAQLDARMNGFALITDDVAEIGQFQTATEGATTGLYELTDVIRGQLDTVATSHTAGDTFVLLDENVVFLPLDVALAGQTLIFRAVSIGTVPANNPTTSLVFDPPTFIIDGGDSTT